MTGGRLDGLTYPLAGIPEAKARLLAEGREVIDLGAGDPGLPVPDAAVEALRRAALDPRMQGYAFQRGLPELREEIAAWMKRRYGRSLDPYTEVLPLVGSKEGIAHLTLAVTEPGDVVLVPDPGFAAYRGGVAMAAARPHAVALRMESGFLVPPDSIRHAPSPLRLVYLNYPNNPTGASADLAYLEEVVEACRERGTILAYDNAYSEIAYDGYRPPSLLEVDGALDVGVEFHSFSKSFNMTGWRLGWACGSAELIGALTRLKMFIDTGAYLGIQAAGAATLRIAEDFLQTNVERLRQRRDAAVSAFGKIGFDVPIPRATLYLWMPVPGAEPCAAFAARVLESSGVVLLPGSALGAAGEGYVRAAFTVPPKRYALAAERVSAVL